VLIPPLDLELGISTISGGLEINRPVLTGFVDSSGRKSVSDIVTAVVVILGILIEN